LTRIALGALLVFMALPAGLRAAECSAESGARRAPLLELYTSEGCDSCPPADRWVSGLPSRGLSAAHIVTLGFHVDYWNYLGWNDPYARPEYSARQRAASRRNRATVVYTPQILLNGKDYRRGVFKDTLADDVAALNRSAPRARISLKAAFEPAGTLSIRGSAHVQDPAERTETRVVLAIYENRLVNDVRAGENRGKRLPHDFVVRALAGPYTVGRDGTAVLDHRLMLDPGWKPADLGVAAFVQNERTGDVLQALSLPQCGGGARSARRG
jgi:hypothetical protein